MLNTLSKYKELERIIIGALEQNITTNVGIITANDFEEDRDQHMVVVGVTNVSNVNPMLPDYQYDLDILIDCFIDEDKGGAIYQSTTTQVMDFLQKYLMDKNKLPQLFGDFPVVGLFLTNVANMTTEQSNQTRITLQIIASFNEE